MGLATSRRRPLLSSILSKSDAFCETLDKVDEEEDKEEMEESSETLLYSFSPLPLMLVAALPGGIDLFICFELLYFHRVLSILITIPDLTNSLDYDKIFDI